MQKKQWKKFKKFPPLFYNSQILVEVGITRKELATRIPKPKAVPVAGRGKAPGLRPTIGMVSRQRVGDHGGVSNHRLPAKKNLHLVGQ